MTPSDELNILRHDIQAVLVNHSALQKEISDSLTRLNELLREVVPGSEDSGQGSENLVNENHRQQINDLLLDDIEQCMPMLQLSSDRLSRLLHARLDYGKSAN